MGKIQCKGYSTFDGEFTEYECEYEHDRCDDCVCVPFGRVNPITGKNLNLVQYYFKCKKDRKELKNKSCKNNKGDFL